MNHLGIPCSIRNIPELDPAFLPLHVFNTAFLAGARQPIGIAVERACWGKGVGRQLTLSCIECARKAGYLQVELDELTARMDETASSLRTELSDSGERCAAMRRRTDAMRAMLDRFS